MDDGFYGKHTWRLSGRLREHLEGEKKATAGGNLVPVWNLLPLGTGDGATD